MGGWGKDERIMFTVTMIRKLCGRIFPTSRVGEDRLPSFLPSSGSIYWAEGIFPPHTGIIVGAV